MLRAPEHPGPALLHPPDSRETRTKADCHRKQMTTALVYASLRGTQVCIKIIGAEINVDARAGYLDAIIVVLVFSALRSG